MKESANQTIIWKAASKIGYRLFRNNVGMAWQGKRVKINGRAYIQDPRPIHFGLHEGSADLIGWKTVTITRSMVGKKIAVFVSVEAKSDKGKAQAKQRTWKQNVSHAGGLAVVAKSECDIPANPIIGDCEDE